jgi:hypothetical protein
LEKAPLAILLELGDRAGARLTAERSLVVGHDALLLRAKDYRPVNAGKVRLLCVALVNARGRKG